MWISKRNGSAGRPGQGLIWSPFSLLIQPIIREALIWIWGWYKDAINFLLHQDVVTIDHMTAELVEPYVGALWPRLVLRHFGLVRRTFFWHFKTANACFFSKLYTTMKFQLVCRKFQLVCTHILERCNWSVQTHWSKGAHVWLELYRYDSSLVQTIPVGVYPLTVNESVPED